MIKKILLVLFFCFPFLSHAEKMFHLDEKETWIVVVAEFEISDESPDSIYIRNSLPGFLLDRFSVCKRHRLSENEASLLRKKIVSDKITAGEKNLSDLIEKRDLSYLTGDGERDKLEDSIKEAEKLLRELKKYNHEKIKIRNDKEIVFIPESAEEKTAEFETISIESYAKDRNADYIIYGSAMLYNDVIYLEIRLYSLLEKSDIYAENITTDINSLFVSLEKPVNGITSLLLGVPWSKLTVKTDNSAADIYLDGKYIGTSVVINHIAPPGSHQLTVSGDGVSEKKLDIILDENEETVFDITTTYHEEKLTAINTIPQGADVYHDSLWKGRSPFLLNGKTGEIILKKEGFRESRYFLEDIEENQVVLKLSPDIFDQDDFLEKKRNNFYTNLTFFVLSVPVPFFMFAALNDYSDAYNNSLAGGSNQDETERLRKLTNFTYYGYYGSLFLTVSLFINTIFHLNDYIRAADVLSARQF